MKSRNQINIPWQHDVFQYGCWKMKCLYLKSIIVHGLLFGSDQTRKNVKNIPPQNDLEDYVHLESIIVQRL